MTCRLLVLAAVLAACGQSSRAQDGRVSIDAALHTSDKPYVQATGQATISARPDEALIEIGVVSQGPTGAATAEQNPRQTAAVLADLSSFLDTTKRLKTTSYSAVQ